MGIDNFLWFLAGGVSVAAFPFVSVLVSGLWDWFADRRIWRHMRPYCQLTESDFKHSKERNPESKMWRKGRLIIAFNGKWVEIGLIRKDD